VDFLHVLLIKPNSVVGEADAQGKRITPKRRKDKLKNQDSTFSNTRFIHFILLAFGKIIFQPE
jgi:hypothetical protein